jgi:hypothetical protein
MDVEVEFSDRWNRECVAFRWEGFADLLPEERFHRLMQLIPDDFREANLGGYVWLELAGDESIDTFLSFPRSEDVAPREEAVYRALLQLGYFDAMEVVLGPAPDKSCAKDFTQTLKFLGDEGMDAEQVRDAKLVFIRHGAFCDCQVLFAAQPALAEAYDGEG